MTVVRSLEDSKSAALERQRGENNDDTKVLRYDSTPEESPHATVWLTWTPNGIQIRLLRDIIVPRKDVFWKFGINHSSVSAEGKDNDQDFFWLAPLDAKPVLGHANDDFGSSKTTTTHRTFIDPSYFSYSGLGQYWGGT